MIDGNTILAVRSKGQIVAGNNPNERRKDSCGAWMGLNFYGNRDSKYGREVDHINPSGGDYIYNLQPLQRENNVVKGNGRQVCKIVANGIANIARY